MKGITVNLDAEKLAEEIVERITDEVSAVIDDRIEEYIEENIGMIAQKVKKTQYSEKQAVQDQLIGTDGLMELLDIDREEAEKIIGTVKERIEQWGDITLSDKVPKSKVFSLLGISYSTDPKKRKTQDYVNKIL